MARKIEAYLATAGTRFIIVGAGHLVGDDGIVALLRKQGYAVQQLEHARPGEFPPPTPGLPQPPASSSAETAPAPAAATLSATP
jgi:hypothetical protein